MSGIRGRAVRSQAGATLVGFAITFPVLMGAVASGLFADHAYAVKSDLQRTAEEAARYGATRCDPRGTYSSGGCHSGQTYPTTADVVSYVNTKFTTRGSSTFVADCNSSLSTSTPALVCVTLDPSTPTTPAPNQRYTVTWQFRYTSPFDGLVHIIPGASGLVDLKVARDAVVE